MRKRLLTIVAIGFALLGLALFAFDSGILPGSDLAEQRDPPLVTETGVTRHSESASDSVADNRVGEGGASRKTTDTASELGSSADIECSDCDADAGPAGQQARDAYQNDLLAKALLAQATGRLMDVSEDDRLAVYNEFTQRPIDAMWSATTQNRILAGVDQAMQIGVEVSPELIDCRDSSCLIRYQRSPQDEEYQVLTDLGIALGLARYTANSEIQRSALYSDVYLTNIESFSY
ncbi:MAG: hypothetical protein AAF270_04315 [Pseudomonadota bacterium]